MNKVEFQLPISAPGPRLDPPDRVYDVEMVPNYREECGIVPLGGQTELVHKLLTGSQAKTAWALRYNAEKMCEGAGLERIGFLTLTVGDKTESGFKQVWDASEASRRINNLGRRILPVIFERGIIATERHSSGAIHFHILGVLLGRPDIRSGFDFDKVAAGDYRSVPEELREIWKFLREVLPKYGFGRAELLPIKKTGEAVAAYVGKYIEKNVCNRRKEDKRKKLVRYFGWNKEQLKANEFSWAGPKATAWRLKSRELVSLVGLKETEECYDCFGPRWAFHLSRIWKELGDNIFPGLCATDFEKRILRQELVKFKECRKRARAGEWGFVAPQSEDYWAVEAAIVAQRYREGDGEDWVWEDLAPDYWESFPGCATLSQLPVGSAENVSNN